ncbi:minor capsid protein [Actinomadura terrae]|uniref:minor capsid protein n=1 Tax=Actinomadura terrae TaxID=604353 RepID=UPI001FA739D7|nr:minor capsid protein [Actinomadura terrae]
MGWTNNLLVGLAEELAARGIARWQPTGAYPPDGPPPVFLRSLGDAPDAALALAAYGDPENEDAGLSHVIQAVQIRTRAAAPDAVDDLADRVWDEFHGATMLRLGTGPNVVATTLIRRRSSAALGRDARGRYERTDNYYVTAARPTAHRPD